MRTPALVLCVLVFSASCGESPRGVPPAEPSSTTGSTSPDAGAVDAGVVDPASLAPKRWPQVANAVTHDVDADLAKVLETQALQGACQAAWAGTADQATRLRCGKWMFFYETYGTVGIPSALLDFLQKHYASTFYGDGFSNLGLILDPASAKKMPLGIAATTGKLGSLETRAFTCASCHFGKMADGRYAVGYPNHGFDYGKLISTLGAPLAMSFDMNSADVAPEIRQMLAGPVTAAKAKQGYSYEAGALGLQLSSAGNSGRLTVQQQQQFLSLRTGTLDFMFPPLLDDGAWTVSRIVSLWNFPNAEQRAAASMPHELLALNGGVPVLMDFLHGFVAIGVSKGEWTDARLAPLEEYLRTLRAPVNLTAPSTADATEGARLFVTAGCVGCHAGPSGEGNRVFTFAEVGTDSEYANLYGGDGGTPCCDIPVESATRGVKAPRMGGLFAQTRMFHNGAIGSLEELFCVTPRDPSTALAQTSVGHTMTCDALTDGQKQSLMSYLRSL